MGDPLLQPTLQGESPPEMPQWMHVPERPAPWNVSSQFWVAFFGGAVPVGIIAWFNAGRLRMPASARAWIIGLTVAAWAVTLWLQLQLWSGAMQIPFGGSGRMWGRVLGRLLAIVLYLGFARMQRKPDRIWRMFSGREYAPLYNPGLAAVFVGLFVQVVPFAILSLDATPPTPGAP